MIDVDAAVLYQWSPGHAVDLLALIAQLYLKMSPGYKCPTPLCLRQQFQERKFYTMHQGNDIEVKNTGRHMSDWECDLARYGTRRAFLREQSLWAVWLYRQGRRLDQRSPGFGKKWRTTLYWLAFRLVETITGVSLPKSASIGPGLRIWHFGSIFVHPDAKIGANCTLRQGVTIGNRHVDGPVPVVGDNVELGAYTQILGGVKIGNNCRIGAMTVVLTDMPDGSTAVGAASRLILHPGTNRKSVD